MAEAGAPADRVPLEFRLLGALEVSRGGARVALAGERQRELLAMLLLRANELVTTEQLVDELFAGGSPDVGAGAVRVAISRLRRQLGDDAVIETRSRGYALTVDPDRIDAARFERLIDQARRAAAAGDPLARVVSLREALALWRGPALADLAGFDFAQDEARRLEELRLGATMDRIDADLELGRSVELVSEIQGLVSANPYQERLRGQLMLALYRSGRQADALEAYRRASEHFRDELAIEPGRALQELERRILVHDPALELGPGSADAGGEPLSPPAPAASHRRLALVVAIVVVAGAGAGIAVGVSSSGGSSSAVVANAVVALDPHSGNVIGHLTAGDRPAQIAIDAHDVWVLNADDGTISRIDPGTRRTTQVFSPASTPADIAAGDGALFIADQAPATLVHYTGLPFALSRYDPALRVTTYTSSLPHVTPSALAAVPSGASQITVGGGFVWVIAPDQTVAQLDERTGARVRTLNVTAISLLFADGALWVLDGRLNGVRRVSPRTGATSEQIPIPEFFAPTSLALGDGYVWVASPIQGVVWKLDPAIPRDVASINVGFGASVVAYGDGALWVGNDVSDAVSRIDPRTLATTATVHVPSPQSVAVGDGAVWVTAGSIAGRSGPLAEAGCSAPAGPSHPDVRIVSDLTLNGNFSLYSLPSQRAILRVLAAHHFRAGRFTVGYQACNDGSPLAQGPDDSRCTANAQDYALDASIVAVIGPPTSGCANDQIGVSSRAPRGPLAFISPLATESFLSRAMTGLPRQLLVDDYPHGTGNFLRTIGDDHIQVAADAQFAKRLGLRRVVVLFFPPSFIAQTQARWFAYSSARLHGPLAVPVSWNGASASVAIAAVAAAHPDGVFITSSTLGPPPQAKQILAGLKTALGPGTPIILTDAEWPWWMLVQQAGSAVNGVYASIAGIVSPADLPAQGRAIVRAVGGPGWAVAGSAAATQAVLAAVARSDGTRRSVLHALERLRLAASAVGPLAFNSAGEPVTGPVTISRLEVGATNDSGVHDFKDSTIVTVITPPISALPPP